MKDFGWTNLLQKLQTISPEIVLHQGASDAEIADLEQHLGMVLPASFKSLLQISNGIETPDYHVDSFLSTEHIEWFSVDNSNWIDLYNPPEEEEEEEEEDDDDEIQKQDNNGCRDSEVICLRALTGMVQISSCAETVVLLNPAVKDVNGDWQAVLFANWIPGVERYKNLQDLIANTFDPKSKALLLSTFADASANTSKQQSMTANNNDDAAAADCPQIEYAPIIKEPLFWAIKPREHYINQLHTGNTRQRKQAIAALALICDNRDITTLADCLEDKDPLIAVLAARFLRKFPSDLTCNLSTKVHQSKNPMLVLEAAELQLATNQTLTTEVLEAVCQLLKTAPNDAHSAACILGQCKRESAIEAMAQAVEFWVSHRGYQGLNPVETVAVKLGMHGEAALPAIERLLNHTDSSVRRHATTALSLIKTEAATRLLNKAAKDKDQYVREAATQKLKGRKKPGLFGFGRF